MKTRRAYDASEHELRRPRGLEGLPLASAPPAPVVKARRVLNAFEGRRPTNASLSYVRGKLVELYERRLRTMPESCWFVTADCADDILKAWSEFPSGGSANWRGAIFRTKEWERIPGDVPSLRPSHNGTPLARWRPRRAGV